MEMLISDCGACLPVVEYQFLRFFYISTETTLITDNLGENSRHTAKSGDMRSGCRGWNGTADREQLSAALDGGQR